MQAISWPIMQTANFLTPKLKFDVFYLTNQPVTGSTYQLINLSTHQLILCI